jgi:hypothetical protein
MINDNKKGKLDKHIFRVHYCSKRKSIALSSRVKCANVKKKKACTSTKTKSVDEFNGKGGKYSDK